MASPSDPHTPPVLPAPIRCKRLLPPVAKALAALGLLWLIGWLALPLWLKPLLERHASQALGRVVTLDTLALRPWSLELELLGLRVAPAATDTEKTSQNSHQRLTDGTSQLSIQRLYVDAELSSLLRLAPVVDAVRIEKPVLHITHHGQGRHDWQDVLDRLTAPQDPPPPDTGPARLALYNLELLDGEVHLQDGPEQRRHTATGIALSVPFISTLGLAKDVRVSPQLAFTLNGSAFETQAHTQPFDASLATEATLRIRGLDLAPYLDYLPRHLPVRPTQAVLGADLKVSFVQTPTPRVHISGVLSADGVALADAQRQPLLQLASARVELADVRPLERVVQLGAVALTEPRLRLARSAQGQLNALPLDAAEITKTEAKKPIPTSAIAQNSFENKPPSGWAISATGFDLSGGHIDWRDALTPDTRHQPAQPAQLALTQLQLRTGPLQWPLPTEAAQALGFELSAQLTGGGATPPKATTPRSAPASISLSGTALAQAVNAQLGLENLALERLAPYLQAHLVPKVKGQLALQAQARWQPATPASPAGDLTLALDHLRLAPFSLTQGGNTLASLDALEVRNAQLRPLARTANLGHITLKRPVLPLQRHADGGWMAAAWLKTPTAPAAPATPDHTASPTPPPQAPWAWQLPELSVTDGQLTWRDAVPTPAVALHTSAVKLGIKGLQSRGGAPATVSAQLRIGAASGHTEPGTLVWQGTVALGDDGQTPQVRGQLNARRLPAHALAPYAADRLNLTLQRADASFNGRLAFASHAAGPTVQLLGDATLEDFRAHVSAPQAPAMGGDSGELLRWKTLNLKALSVALAPRTAPEVGVESGALADFFARIAIAPDGRINLQNIAKAPPGGAVAAAAAPATPAPPAAPAARIRVGPFSLVNGAVDFSDQFIRPNYQAQLSDLTGRLGGFSSEAPPGGLPQMAALELRGKAEGTASLDITGQLNPLATPLALDIEGRVRDLELPPLSPYAIKYTGHGIERGKLSLDVNYTVQPNGQLTARNQLVLNQLTFGDAVAGAPASLPVKLAVALLADRQGVIDLNLPIAGSLNDPEFSLLPLVFKVVGNVIVKAITSPFALLTGALGGDDADTGSVAFVPGTARLAPGSADKLARVAQALTDKPRLTLTVVGAASLDAERNAYRHERLLAQLREERARQTPGADTSGELDAAEHTRWLAAVYKRSDMPKPRNALGLAQDIAPEDMQALLLAQVPATEAHMHALATQRGAAVRDHLLRLKVPAQRLFLGAPTHTPTTPPPPEGGTWQPTAVLTLAL